jgi:hypothetical protein
MGRTRFDWVVVLALPVAAIIGASVVGGDERAPGARPSIGGTTIEDQASGLSIRVPEGWHGVVGRSGSGFEVYIGRRYVYDPECTGVDETVNITIEEREIPSRRTKPRPTHFTKNDGKTDTWKTIAEIQCDEIWQLVQFSDEGRTFHALVRSGRHGSDAQRDQADAILDTFKVRPAAPR